MSVKTLEKFNKQDLTKRICIECKSIIDDDYYKINTEEVNTFICKKCNK